MDFPKLMMSTLAIGTIALLSGATEAKPKKGTAPKSTNASSASPSTASSGEWSLQDKEYWAKLDEEMKGWADAAAKKCGAKIVGTFEKESFRGHLTEGGSYGLSTYARAHCQAGFSALEDICNGDMAKASVQKKLAAIECKWGGKGKSAIDISGTKLTTTIDMDGDNAATYQGKITEVVKKKL